MIQIELDNPLGPNVPYAIVATPTDDLSLVNNPIPHAQLVKIAHNVDGMVRQPGEEKTVSRLQSANAESR